MCVCIYIYEPPPKSIVYAWYKNISYRSLGGALSLSSVLLKSTLNTAKMQGKWLHGFRSKLPGMDWGPFVVFAFATMLGSYLSTFLDSFLSKEICYDLIFLLLGSNESIPPPGSLFQQKVIARLSLMLSLNWNILMIKKGKGRKEERRTKRTIEKTGRRNDKSNMK